jgi:hypothetical protein
MTKPHFLRVALLGALAVLCAAAVAIAAAPPDRTTTLNSATAETTWTGPEASGSYDPLGDYSVENCSKEAESYCDNTLLKIESGGPVTLDVDIADYSNPESDFDLRVYKSDATGKATDDDEVTVSRYPENPFGVGSTGLPNGFEEGTTIEDLDPGYYLVVVTYYSVDGGTYTGTAKVTGATPAPSGEASPTPTASSTPSSSPAPQQAAAPSRSTLPFKAATTVGSAKKASKTRKLAFSATAEDTITGLTVQLFKGKTIYGTAKVATFAKGTRTVKLKLSKRAAKKLKKGGYTLGSRGTVNGQALQAIQGVKIKK